MLDCDIDNDKTKEKILLCFFYVNQTTSDKTC